MLETTEERTHKPETPRRGLSTISAVSACVGALVLAYLLYGVVGFPENLPLAFGVAVLIAEVVELLARGGASALTQRELGRSLVHGVVVAGACWLGVWLTGLLGWTG